MKIKRYIPTIALSLSIALAFIAGFIYATLISSDDTNSRLPEEFDSLSEVWELLQQSYVNESSLDPEILSQGAIWGMLEALDDPYTAYFEYYELEYSDLEGTFEGIGAYISTDDGPLTVISPIAGSPADEAGIMAGDVILEIDGETTDGLTVIDAVLKIRGPKGTTVTLLIQHPDEDTPVEIQIVRDEITLPSVYGESISSDIAYIQITYFSPHTTGEFAAALGAALETDPEGIIIDLRGNPGGYLYVVADITDEFLEGGVILYESNDNLEIFEEWAAEPGGLATDIPLAVLVNEGSASSSEVLAGALQDHERASIVGTTTYGKGSVNILVSLNDGSALYMTIARWLTPDKHMIDGVGITPDFVVEMDEEDIENDIDTQLEFAVEYLESLAE
ncbi:MAG: S41 family peptidase [Chloroflexota bacterium]|nr:S41 family peptidase [Chloroflexota bacterium]